MKSERDFKGIWIPKEVWLNKKLTLIEKCFLVEIDSLDNEDGCFASNGYFSDFFGVSKGRCTQVIKNLEAKGFIKIRLIREGKAITKRVIRILNRVVNKLNTLPSKTKYPYLENDEDNNTVISNTINNNTIIENLKIQLLEDQIQKDRTCMSLKITSEFYTEKIDVFISESKATEKATWKNYSEFKKHFFYWLKNEVQNGITKNKNGSFHKRENKKSALDIERERRREKYRGIGNNGSA